MQRAHIVVPVYRQANVLPALLADIKAYLRSSQPFDIGLDVRFCIADDGSPADDLAATERALYASNIGSSVTLLPLRRTRGRGGAIHAGFERALREGFDYQGFMDADSSVTIDDLHHVLAYLVSTGRDLRLAGAVGCRVKTSSRPPLSNPLGRWPARVFATFLALHFRCDVHDARCGLKIFDASVLTRHLDAPTDTRWLWDTQLLLAMLHAGERVHEIPIECRARAGSNVPRLRDVPALIRFKRRLKATATQPLPAPPQAV